MIDLMQDLNKRIDHSALKAVVNENAIISLCNEARQFGFFAVAVNPVWVKRAADLLQDSGVTVVSTVGFPLGANRTDVKAVEAAKAVADGAAEIDMVANIGWIKSGNFKGVEDEVAQIRRSVPFNILLKVIIEAPLLAVKEQTYATEAVIAGGAQFVKTSTGFSGDVTVGQVRTILKATDGQIKVKASGGIRSPEQCRDLIKAGANRLGSSSSVLIMQKLKSAK